MSDDKDIGRLEGKVDLMLEKQSKLEDWFISHAKSDNEKFDAIHSSISGMKGKMYATGAIALAILEGGRHAFTSWFTGK